MPAEPFRSLAGKRVLIVEDEYLIADDLAHYLRQRGATIVGPVATIEQARTLASTAMIDCAIVDLDLRGEAPYELLDHLQLEGLPALIVSGYDVADIPPRFRDLPYIQKPASLSNSGVSGTILRMLR
jgi:DNA-binding NarL/FixJ family response regulator